MIADPTPKPDTARQGHDRFANVLHAEWTKLHTVRGWVIGIALIAVFIVLFAFLTANGNHASGPPVPSGPGGVAVADTYELVGHSVTGNGTLTARVTSLSGRISTRPANAQTLLAASRPSLDPWAKAGIIVTSSTRQGAPYAAVMATGAHGVRFQYDYTHDAAGVAGGVAAGSRRWLRLVRSGDTLTAYDSADGHSWSRVGTVHLAGLPATVQMGLFVTSPTSSAGLPTLATGAFDRVSLQAPDTFGAWQGHSIGAGGGYATLPTIAPGSYAQTDGSFVVTGSGDIAPLLYNQVAANTVSDSLPFALIVGLLAAIVVATMFVTSEYRRGLIRTTFTAMPQRQLVLAGKVVVIGTVAFLAGAVAAAIAVPVGAHVARANGDFIFTVSTLAELRIILGSGVVVALGALGALGLATALRRSAGVITAGVVAFALPYMLALPSSLGSGATEWLYRVTPLAGFAVLQALPRYTQVSYSYTVANGYYPLAPWAGLGVLCAYAAVALAIAAFRLSRSDA